MPAYPDYSTPYYATATGTVCITSANARLQGILFHGTGTGKIMLFAGVTSTVTTGSSPISGNIIAYATVAGATANQALYLPFPANCNGGITAVIGPSADPKITLFWSPV